VEAIGVAFKPEKDSFRKAEVWLISIHYRRQPDVFEFVWVRESMAELGCRDVVASPSPPTSVCRSGCDQSSPAKRSCS